MATTDETKYLAILLLTVTRWHRIDRSGKSHQGRPWSGRASDRQESPTTASRPAKNHIQPRRGGKGSDGGDEDGDEDDGDSGAGSVQQRRPRPPMSAGKPDIMVEKQPHRTSVSDIIQLKEYDGCTSLETFIQQFRTCATYSYYKRAEEDNGVYLRRKLTC